MIFALLLSVNYDCIGSMINNLDIIYPKTPHQKPTRLGRTASPQGSGASGGVVVGVFRRDLMAPFVGDTQGSNEFQSGG